MEAGHRSFDFESAHPQDSFQDGNSSVSPSLCSKGGLDGVSRLKDAYLQVPVHPNSRRYLRFVAFGQVYQFKALCFGLSTAPQVFTRVMAQVSTFLYHASIHIRRYLDDWLIQASSGSLVLQALETVLRLCQSLGIVVN